MISSKVIPLSTSAIASLSKPLTITFLFTLTHEFRQNQRRF